jgi:hypothetical protein
MQGPLNSDAGYPGPPPARVASLDALDRVRAHLGGNTQGVVYVAPNLRENKGYRSRSR